MKNILFLFFFNSSFIVNLFAQSGWVWQNPIPQGNEIGHMKFVDPNTGFITATEGTLLRTTSCGVNWTIIQTELPSDLRAISVVNPAIIYVAGSEQVYKTTNSGVNWIKFNIDSSNYIYSIHFINESTGFVGASGKIWKTTNGCLSWNPLSAGSGSINGLYFLNENTGFFSGPGGILKTSNGGINWAYVYQGGIYLDMTFSDMDTGYAVSGGRILKSTNGGNNWFTSYLETTISLTSLSAFNSSYVAACGYNGIVITTTNGGINWSLLHAGLGITPEFRGISYIDPNTLITGGEHGIINKSSNGGGSWFHLSTSVTNFDFNDTYFINSQTGFAAGLGGTFKTTNSGSQWFSSYTEAYTVYFINTLTGYIAGANGTSKTTDAGQNWFTIFTNNYRMMAVFFINENTGFTGGLPPGQIARTTDGGVNWTNITFNPSGQIEKIYFINSLTGFIITGTNGILRTSDSGFNWNYVNSGGLEDIDFVNVFTGYGVGGYWVFKTTDAGLNWLSYIPIIRPYPLETINCIKFINSNTGYIGGNFQFAGSSTSEICKTTDGGLNWVSEYLHAGGIRSISPVNEDTIFVSCGNGGILRRTNALVGIININLSTPDKFNLFQNYPNPFNPETKIRFDIPLTERDGERMVRVIIYDVLGREITTLVNEQLKPGNYEISWNAVNYPSGVYYYKLTAESFSKTKKMVLIK